MKVAVLLAGHLRCWETVFPNFKQYVIDRFNPDIFIHSWDNEGWWTPTTDPKGVDLSSTPVDLDKVRAFYNPVDVVLDNFADYQPMFDERAKLYPNFHHRPANSLSLWFKVGCAVQLMERHVMKTGEKYDLVIRMRPDLVFSGEPLPNFDPANFYSGHLSFRHPMGMGTNDNFLVGSFDAMCKFGKLALNFQQLYDEAGAVCPHVQTEQQIRTLGVPWIEFGLPVSIMNHPKGQYAGGPFR